MTRRGGRHFLQIPGPTNVPDRILRAIDQPTIDHRGPQFAALAEGVLQDVRTMVAEAKAEGTRVAGLLRDAAAELRAMRRELAQHLQ